VEKFLLLRALFVVSATRVALWLSPIGSVRHIAFRDLKTMGVAYQVSSLVWAVKAVSRFVPAATCLTQALALQCLLARSGHVSSVYLGARRGGAGKFEAHAWVECEDRVVIGGAHTQEYIPLAGLWPF
jgi:hypothetical protein